jgi:two-component system, response regulator PdtaR
VRNQKHARAVVLIVEDEPLVLMNAVELAIEAGFEALAANDADEAIAILEARNDIRVIFTDINMPGSMDGLKLAQAVRNRWPPVEIIVTSALSLGPEQQMPTRGVFLPKPYTPAQIADALRRFVA